MILRRKWKVTENNCCVLCVSHGLETQNHLFFECLFSSRIWSYLQIGWSPDPIYSSISNARKRFQGPCFIEITILACWNIWKQRNNYIFENVRPSFRGWKAGFLADLALLKHRLKDSLATSLVSWLSGLP